MYLEREKDVGAGGGRVQVGPPGLAGVCVTQRSKRKQEAGEKEGEGEATENPGQHAHSGSEAGRGFAARGSGSEAGRGFAARGSADCFWSPAQPWSPRLASLPLWAKLCWTRLGSRHPGTMPGKTKPGKAMCMQEGARHTWGCWVGLPCMPGGRAQRGDEAAFHFVLSEARRP